MSPAITQPTPISQSRAPDVTPILLKFCCLEFLEFTAFFHLIEKCFIFAFFYSIRIRFQLHFKISKLSRKRYIRFFNPLFEQEQLLDLSHFFLNQKKTSDLTK